MKSFYILANALRCIEENLCEPITQEEISAACHCSLSTLQKLFRYAFHRSLKEYLSKRRMTCAARELARGDVSVTEVAFKYQYHSPEVFSRAFSRAWGCTPSAFRTKWRFTGLCPKIEFDCSNAIGGIVMPYRKVDISELYDVLREKLGSYVLCFDIAGLSSINQVSREAGDRAILECLRRIDEAATEDMLLFRVGGDEFALVTGLNDAEEAKSLGRRILAHNGETIQAGGRAFSVSMWVGMTRFPDKSLRYSELFYDLQGVINTMKRHEESEVWTAE